ncbi:hypothetical protein MYCTH_2294310 [Thermothelomyces thermophilus ATCC 42464]|uniref:CAP-Gly domain-containing protein n=1 Tax=Thermothelomyces thermophilus (strain ATCC 42464 / BCRC 31852 / DSM 1799) TaxID=573729 RepID=G2Q0U4_THET4|nr:uncharacterized protein MYCTH_2294310 [Thermothelomyces thermophilus ATCC 42464]AEO53244.1 hypothetical protein MYCTH_2294310 [Thermothelomyces thermophilus ATCC 42464]
MPLTPRIGERRSYDGALCTVRYIGEVAGTTGSWLGVEWDDPSRGKHDGQHKGVRYFSCTSKSPNAASFVRPTRAADPPQTFLSALQHKYAGGPAEDQAPARQIKFSGKVAEEVGFDKIRRQQAQLHELQFVILDGLQVAHATDPEAKDGHQSIAQVCPKVKELDLSRNLFERFGPVVDICAELKQLRSLRVNGNRFRDVLDDDVLEAAGDAFHGVTELALEDTLLSWHEICHIASKFPSLTTLHAGSNQLTALAPIPPAPFTTTLTSLHLEFNDFTSLSELAPLASISTLRNLLLKGNRISTISPPSTPAPVFGAQLHHLDLSYNLITSWSFIDALPSAFPGLTSLRITHDPLYSDPDMDETAAALPEENSALSPATQRITSATAPGAKKTEEAYMLTLARLPSLRILNFSTITPADRADAEMFYLSRIARQLASVPESGEAAVLRRHRRWAELCETYGEPAVVRRTGRDALDPGFLEARLIRAEFYLCSPPGGRAAEGPERGDGKEEKEEKRVAVVEVPRSLDIYAVKGLVGRLFGLKPLGLRLVWETGEWDPVGGFDEDREGATSEGEQEEEDLEAEWERTQGEGGELPSGLGTRRGRWVKREVELRDGPRQFGYCVDGSEVRIRVERR